MSERFADLIAPHRETKSAEEIAADVITRAGLVVK